jgi:hypothetical protein
VYVMVPQHPLVCSSFSDINANTKLIEAISWVMMSVCLNVRAGITQSGFYHPAGSAVVFALFSAVFLFYLGWLRYTEFTAFGSDCIKSIVCAVREEVFCRALQKCHNCFTLHAAEINDMFLLLLFSAFCVT